MSKSKKRSYSRVGRVFVATAMMLPLSFGVASAQSAAEAQAAAQEQAAAQARAIAEAQAAAQEQAEARARAIAQQQDLVREMTRLTYAAQSGWTIAPESAQLPQDIRIMQRIVSTALGEVEAPELPDALKADADSSAEARGMVYGLGSSSATVWSLSGSGRRVIGIGSRDVTGFYMQGYGYLFTVKWQVAPRGIPGVYVASGDLFRERSAQLEELAARARANAEATQAGESRASSDAEQALQEKRQQLEEQQAAWDGWSAGYRALLADALRGVVALYGSTLNRAQPDESITFIADFGGGDAETVTLSARRGELSGASREQNLSAVHMAKGETGVSESLRTELKIMAEIIDSSMQSAGSGDAWVEFSDQVRIIGGDSSYQYVPGYGVLFRKSARLNLATRVVQGSRIGVGVTDETLRERIEASTEEQSEVYAKHLADLKRNTAAVLATYGPTLTEMTDDEWVGVYYNVGSAAGLLEGGITNFLVQAQMGDIRQAASQANGAEWLLDRLVTNEKQN